MKPASRLTRRVSQRVSGLFVLIVSLLFVGCGNNGSHHKVPLAVSTTSLPNATVGTPYATTNLSATGGSTPYTWSLASGALPGGLKLSSSGEVSGQPTVSGTFTFTVKVADASRGTATQRLSMNVNEAGPLSIATTSGSLPQGGVNTAYPTTNLSASGGVQPYTWTKTAGTLPTGMNPLSSSGQISGTPTALGTFDFTVQVRDSSTPTPRTATATLSITIITPPCAGYGTGNESLLNGHYAFLTQGFSGGGALRGFAAVGSFAADGTDKITGGEVDSNGVVNGPQHLTGSTTGGLYTIGSDHRGCAVMSFSGSNTVVIHFAVGAIGSGVASRGRMIEFDDNNGMGIRNSGILRRQTAADFSRRNLNSRYAFGIDGTDATGSHVTAGGSMNLNTSTGGLSNGYADLDDGGTLVSGVTGATGTIGTISATTGRATGSFNGGTGASFSWVYYVVNKDEIFIITTAGSQTALVMSGRAIVTGSSFSRSSLDGNYIIHVSGSQNGISDATIGLLSLSGGAVKGTLYQYRLTGRPSSQTSTITNGTYAVNSASGRVTLNAVGNKSPVLYLTSLKDGISAFIIGADNSAIFGLGEFQPSGNYSTGGANAVSGNYFFGTEDPSDNTTDNEVGAVTLPAAPA